MNKILFIISAWLTIPLGIIGFIIHIWTIYIAYGEYGVIGGIVSLFLPFISEVFFVVASLIGIGWTVYAAVVITYFASLIIVSVVNGIASTYSDY